MAARQSSEHRKQAMAWARALLLEGDFLILDTETTGLSPRDEIIQVGIIDKWGEVLFDSLVKPMQPISPGAAAVNGLRDRDVADAPTFIQLYPMLRDIMAQQAVVAYNWQFDERMLKQTLRRYQLPRIPLGDGHCAMDWYARYFGRWNRRQGSYAWQSLTAACRYEGIAIERAHAAVADCRLTLALVERMAGKGSEA